MRGSYGLINRTVSLIDAMTVVGASQGLQAISPCPGAPLTVGQGQIVGLLGAAALVAMLRALGAYRVERYRRPRTVLFDLLLGLAAACVAGGVVLSAFAPLALMEQDWLVRWGMATLGVLILSRCAVAAALQGAGDAGWLKRRAVVIGEGEAAHVMRARLRAAAQDFTCLGLFGTDPGARGDLAALRRLAQTTQIDLIVIAASWDRPGRLFELAEGVQWISADVAATLETPCLFAGSRFLTEVAGAPALLLARHPFKGTEGLVKAAQDYAVALVAVVLTAPVMAMAALAIKLQDGGPVLFRQARLGFNGRPFHCYKLRTMSVDTADDGARGTRAGDPRITRVGAFLRRTSIDELPQLFNVLRGEMSIVGPRPHVPNMQVGAGPYAETVRVYAARHQIKPGITGWAQINGMRGGIDTPDKARRGVDLDLYYIRHWSIGLDLRIMFLTLTRHMVGPQVF